MKSKRAILTGTILLLALYVVAFKVPVVQGSRVFSDGFETGDMSLWTNHSGTGFVDVISSLEHHDTYSANFSGNIKYWKDLGSIGYIDLYFRCYVYIYALPSSGNSLPLFALYDIASSQSVIAAIGYGNGDLWYWRLQAPDCNEGALSTIELNTWYCVEIERTQGSGTGAAKLWVDGTLLLENSTLTMDRNSRYPNVGTMSTTFTTAVVYDCCEVATAYIGEEVLFSDGFESGDDNAWTGSWGVHGISTTVVHSGTYSLRLGHTPGYVEANISSSTMISYRWYTYIQNLAFADTQYVLLSRVKGSDGTAVTSIYIDYSVDHYHLELQWSHPSSGVVHHDYPFVADTWYCFEEKIMIGTFGEYRVSVNGLEEMVQTKLDTSGAIDCQHFELGFVDWINLGWNDYIFLDDAAISTTHVEPEMNPYLADTHSDVSESEINATVYDLQDFATRKYGTVGNSEAGTYLHNRLGNISRLSVEYQSAYRNVIATLNGTDPTSDATYVVGAHYDSISSDPSNAPGATDNGGGVAVVLELARIISRYRLRHTLKFALWNYEEGGAIGSSAYAQYASNNGLNISLYFNYDSSCYDPNNRFVLDIVYNNDSEWAANKITEYNGLYGIGFTLQYNAHINCTSDHKSFWNHGYPAVYTHEETHGPAGTIYDKVDKVNLAYARKNGEVGMALLAKLAVVEGLIGDINVDCVVDAQDLHLLDEAYGATPSDTNWNMAADLDHDGVIGVTDLRMLARNYGARGPIMVIFEDGFEGGDFAIWTGAAIMSVDSSVVYSGAKVAHGQVPQNGFFAYVTKNLSASQDMVYVRSYVRFSRPPLSGEGYGRIQMAYTASNGLGGIEIQVVYDAAAGYARFRARNNYYGTTVLGPQVYPDTWYCVETCNKIGGLGSQDWWINGELQTSAGNGGQLNQIDVVQFGLWHVNGASSVDYYLDDVVVADAYIGL